MISNRFLGEHQSANAKQAIILPPRLVNVQQFVSIQPQIDTGKLKHKELTYLITKDFYEDYTKKPSEKFL